MCDADVPTVIVGGNGIGLILRAMCDGYTFDADVPIEDALRAYDKLIAAQHARHDLRRDIRAQLRVPDDVCRCFANVRLQKRDTGKRLNKLISDAPSIVSEWCAKQCKQDWKYLFALQSMGRPSMMRVQRVPQATTGHKVRDGQVKHAKPRHVMDSYAPLGAWVVPSSHDEEALARTQARKVMHDMRKRTAFDEPQLCGEPTLLRPKKSRTCSAITSATAVYERHDVQE